MGTVGDELCNHCTHLFLFVDDALSVILKSEVSANLITPVKVTQRAPGISHLLFADDSLLFVLMLSKLQRLN